MIWEALCKIFLVTIRHASEHTTMHPSATRTNTFVGHVPRPPAVSASCSVALFPSCFGYSIENTDFLRGLIPPLPGRRLSPES
jgi:hypothetical protein